MSGLESVGFGSEVKKVIREQAPLLADVMPATVHIMDWTKNNKELEVIKKGIKMVSITLILKMVILMP